MGKSARRFLWRYLADREDGNDPGAPLFTGKLNRPFNRDALRQLINSLGAKVGIKKCHPHRFRHTFAINYLRNGGNILSLQEMLGHEKLDTVRIYAKVAEVDLEKTQRSASPADNWRL